MCNLLLEFVAWLLGPAIWPRRYLWLREGNGKTHRFLIVGEEDGEFTIRRVESEPSWGTLGFEEFSKKNVVIHWSDPRITEVNPPPPHWQSEYSPRFIRSLLRA